MGLTNKDIEQAENFIKKCSTIQLNLWIGRLNDELYYRLYRLTKSSKTKKSSPYWKNKREYNNTYITSVIEVLYPKLKKNYRGELIWEKKLKIIKHIKKDFVKQ